MPARKIPGWVGVECVDTRTGKAVSAMRVKAKDSTVAIEIPDGDPVRDEKGAIIEERHGGTIAFGPMSSGWIVDHGTHYEGVLVSTQNEAMKSACDATRIVTKAEFDAAKAAPNG